MCIRDRYAVKNRLGASGRPRGRLRTFFRYRRNLGPFVRSGKEHRVKRTPQSSITALLEGVEQAKQKKEFNILKDLKTLHAQYTRVNKRDYLALLDKLVEKYSTDEAAVIHAALLKKCQAGDMDAIRLWTELQKESGSGAAEVNIVDSI